MADAVGCLSILKASPFLTEDFTIRQIFDYAAPCTKSMDTRVSANDLVEYLKLTHLLDTTLLLVPPHLIHLPHGLLNVFQRIPTP